MYFSARCRLFHLKCFRFPRACVSLAVPPLPLTAPNRCRMRCSLVPIDLVCHRHIHSLWRPLDLRDSSSVAGSRVNHIFIVIYLLPEHVFAPSSLPSATFICSDIFRCLACLPPFLLLFPLFAKGEGPRYLLGGLILTTLL